MIDDVFVFAWTIGWQVGELETEWMMTSATCDHDLEGYHQHCVKCEWETNGRRDWFLGCCVSDSVNNGQRGAIVIFNCLMYSSILASYDTSQLIWIEKTDKRFEYTTPVCTPSIAADSKQRGVEYIA